MEHVFKKNEQVIYHFKEWTKVMWSESGWGHVDRWKRAIIWSTPRDVETGRFTTDYRYEDEVIVTLKDEDGKVFETTIDKIEQDVDPCDLTTEELVSLYGQMQRGSMYYSDYRNNLGVFEVTAMDFYEGYEDEVWDDLKEELGREPKTEEFNERLSADGFAAYCQSCESWNRIAA